MSTMKFTSWQDLDGNEVANSAYPPGLVLVKSQTIGSGVSSVTLTDVFSADYQNYRIIGTIIDSSGNVAVYWNSPQETSSVYNWAGTYLAVYVVPTAHTYLGQTGSTYLIAGYSTADTDTTGGCFSMDVYRPYQAAKTMCTTVGLSYIGLNAFGRIYSDTSLTDITFFPSTGSFSGGEIRVYGYNQ